MAIFNYLVVAGGGGGGNTVNGGGGGAGGYQAGTITATGGTITTPGNGNTVHTFTAGGTFQITALSSGPEYNSRMLRMFQ